MNVHMYIKMMILRTFLENVITRCFYVHYVHTDVLLVVQFLHNVYNIITLLFLESEGENVVTPLQCIHCFSLCAYL